MYLMRFVLFNAEFITRLVLCLTGIIALAIPVDGFCDSYKYVKAISGDTLVVIYKGDEIVLRLYGIDAPDIGSINHEKSRKFLDELMKEKNSYIVGRYTVENSFDNYGRHVAVIEKDGVCINEKMIEAGMAYVHPDECKFGICERWKRLEKVAQKEPTSISFIE